MNDKYDIIIAGGGIIGSAAAYELTNKGARVLVIEQTDQASGTAGATDGVVAYHTKKPGFHMDLAAQSIAMFPRLSHQLEANICYVEGCGGMLAIEDTQQLDLLKQLAQEQQAGGANVQIIDIHKARQIEPQLSPKLLGALYSPTASKVDPIALTFAYAAAAKRQGAVFKNHCRVTGIMLERASVKGIHTTSGGFYAPKLIIAAGSWSADLGEMAGITLPIKPRKGQLLVTEPVGPFLKGAVQCARYFVIKNHPHTVTDEYAHRTGASLSIKQTADGAILIGSTRELVGFDRENTLESFQAIIHRALSFFPSLKHVHVIRAFAGLRPYTPDGLPIIGGVGTITGLYIASGHEGDGIALAPITAKLLTEEITTGKPSSALTPFSPDRF